MSDSCRLKCPYCESSLTYRVWFSHICNKHLPQLFDDSASGNYNRTALTFSDTRNSLPTCRFPGVEGVRYICWSCSGAYSRDTIANAHLSHLKQSVQTANEIKEKLQTSSAPNTNTPAFPSNTELLNLEKVAYQRVILNIVEELEDALFWKAKYENCCKDETIYNAIKEYIEDPKQIEYDIVQENKKESKIVDLKRSTLEKARKAKL